MFRHGIPLGKISGIAIDLDYSWFLIVGLIAWMLAASYYPAEFRNWSVGEYWVMGVITAVMLFVSVLIHELAHSLVAKHFGVSVARITLFIFGGVSQIASEMPSAMAEFWMAVVGPITSFALAALFWELEPFFLRSEPLFALVKYLALLNLLLGVFNLIPGFPLDGGRVLRAILWRATGKYQKATAIAATTGRFFGFLLIFVGVWQVLAGNFINGLWIAFIGWFLESAAASQLQQEALKSLLGEHRVLDAMNRHFAHVAGNITLQQLVDKYILQEGLRFVAIDEGGNPRGLVTLAAIRKVPRSAWPTTAASQVMTPLQKLDTTRPNAMLWPALEKMGRDGMDQLPVVDGNGIVGILSREDILHYLRVLRAFAA